jgi:hypothetical protein
MTLPERVANPQPKVADLIERERNSVMGDESPQRKLFSDAIVIAVLTAWLYLVGYAYRFGYATYFRFPEQLVSLGTTMVLQVAFTLGGIFFVYFIFADGIWNLLPKSNTAIAKTVRRYIAFLLLVGLFLMPYKKDLKFALIAFGCVAIGKALMDFVLPLFGKLNKGKSYEEKLESYSQIVDNVLSDRLIGIIMRIAGVQFLTLAFFAIFVVLFSFTIGRQDAKDKEMFYLLEDSPNVAVLAVEGELIIAAPFDPQTKTLKGSFEIRKLSDGKPWLLREDKVGPLKPFEKK